MARTVRKSGVKEVPLSEIKDDLSRYLHEPETKAQSRRSITQGHSITQECPRARKNSCSLSGLYAPRRTQQGPLIELAALYGGGLTLSNAPIGGLRAELVLPAV